MPLSLQMCQCVTWTIDICDKCRTPVVCCMSHNNWPIIRTFIYKTSLKAVFSLCQLNTAFKKKKTGRRGIPVCTTMRILSLVSSALLECWSCSSPAQAATARATTVNAGLSVGTQHTLCQWVTQLCSGQLQNAGGAGLLCFCSWFWEGSVVVRDRTARHADLTLSLWTAAWLNGWDSGLL